MFAVHIASTPKREVWSTSTGSREDRVFLKPSSRRRPAKSFRSALRNRTLMKPRQSDIEIIKHWSKNVFHELFYSDLESALEGGICL